MSVTVNQNLLNNNNESPLIHLINHISAGIWEFNVNTNEVIWSEGFYKILGYEPGEIESSYNYFFECLLYHGDRKKFSRSISERNINDVSTVQIRLLTKSDGYQWFENTVKKSNDASLPILCGTIININQTKISALKSAQKDALFYETGKLAKMATWEIDTNSMNLILSKEGFDIFELNNPVKLSVEELISFFEPNYRITASEAINKTIKYSYNFDMELLLRTARNRVIWTRFKAMPIINEYGKCISIQGILQDIEKVKKKEIDLQNALKLASDQNKRLQNFAYIVSHNLRSHTGNLQFMVNLFHEPESESEKDEVFKHIQTISDSLNTTVKHLEEVVKAQTEINDERIVIEFEPVFETLLNALSNNIEEANAIIEYDFGRCPEINYIPAYMESIFQNLLTNSLKYRHPNRQAVIKCYSYTKNGHIYLVFEDNGLGIDMDRHGDQVFGMYKTFHKNSDAQGIGLFITRNQIESLGGSIKLESKVDTGTQFTIRLS